MTVVDLADSNYSQNSLVKKTESENLKANFENLVDRVVKLSKKKSRCVALYCFIGLTVGCKKMIFYELGLKFCKRRA